MRYIYDAKLKIPDLRLSHLMADTKHKEDC